eukprot:gene6687-10243_t
MCGFSGYFTNKKFSTDESSLLEAMGRSIINRGPDGGGYWFDSAAGIGLSHRRLAIVDLTAAGHQPMHSSSGRFVIAFNGEIYNHGELRALLEESGLSPTWNGHSDTETLLECFEHWGIEKTLQATVGMFAIALWDTRQNELVLARDRLGEKPLYWGWQNDVLLFGSELKALKIHPAFCADIDRDALALYLRHNYIPAPYSIYQGIEKLKPGHYVRIAIDQRRSDVKALPFWSFNRAVEAGLASPLQSDANAVVDTLEAQLSESIGMQMLADVPLGAFLSGGVDSSLVVGLMQKQSPRPVKTFTIGFSEAGVVIGAKEPITVLDTASAWPATQRYEEWMMAMDAQTYMADDILVKVDRAAMASSLETRVPMLDHRVVELAWRIPGRADHSSKLWGVLMFQAWLEEQGR